MKKTAKREYDFHSAKRGVVGVFVPKGKTRITIRLNNGVLAWFREKVEKAGGGDYRTVINEALRQHMRRADEPLEKRLRRVIREETAVLLSDYGRCAIPVTRA